MVHLICHEGGIPSIIQDTEIPQEREDTVISECLNVTCVAGRFYDG